MYIDISKISRTDLIYLSFLLGLVSVYALHLFSFTLFEGFSTLSNDSFSYILLARKWSPYFTPSVAETLTWPPQTFPPGFAWLLAITGGSASTWVGHLVVSISALISIVFIGWFAYRELGWLYGGLLTVCFCLLPGFVVSSMGILSENQYLFASLAVLLLFSIIKKNKECWSGWYVLLLMCLSLSLFTRTIGVSLIAALIGVSLLDQNLGKDKRIIIALIALMTLGLWQFWSLMDPQSKQTTYLTYITPILGHESQNLADRTAVFLGYVQANVFSLLAAWNHYLTLTHSNAYFFLFDYALLIVCVIFLGLRAFQLRLDAIYLLFYFGILLIWPSPDQMVRFLHPVFMLMLLQPVLYFQTRNSSPGQFRFRVIAVSIILVLCFNSLIIQRELVVRRDSAHTEQIANAHSYEYYTMPDRDNALYLTRLFQIVMMLMTESAAAIPEGSNVAAVKHDAYTLLTDRESVILRANKPYHQQLCNFKVSEVDFVFLSPVTSRDNPEHLRLVEKYRSISANIWPMNYQEVRPIAYVLELDTVKIDSILTEAGFECRSL